MKTVARTRSVGGSLVITLPKDIVKEEMICESDLVEIDVKRVKRDFFGALKGVGHFTKEDELQGQLG